MPLFECRLAISTSTVEAIERVLVDLGQAEWSLFEDVLARQAWLIGIFPGEPEAQAGWAALQGHLPRRGLDQPGFRALPDTDWRESYKAHFKAWRCGSLHWVPEWKRASHHLPRGHVAVYLDPGLAFGTGNHETTRLCCRRLVEFARGLAPRSRRSWSVIDAGCGSGILAISAAKLGCRHVFAFDNDGEATAIARKNVRRNRAAPSVRVATGGLGPRLRRRQAELVLANIQADVLMAHTQVLLGAVAPGGRLVLSGILAAERTEVRRVFAAAAGSGWRISSRRLGEWADLVAIDQRRRS